MASQNQYAYADNLFRRIVVAEAELHLLGTYSGTVSYAPRDTIYYGDTKYIALVTVSGTAPVGNHSNNWATLALINQGPVDPFTPIYADLAAIQAIAISGSNLAWSIFTGTCDAYIHDAGTTVKLHHVDFGSGTDQINAYNIPYVNGNGTYPTVQDALDALFYVPLHITSFYNSVNTVEIGSTVTSVNLGWVFNKSIVSQSLSQGIGALPISQRTYTDTGAWTSNRSYTLSTTDGQTPANGNTGITFSNKRYWGTSVNSTLSDAQIIALNSEFANSRNQSRTITAAGEYVYFSYPAAWGAASFTVNGLPNTAWVLTVISFTNASGYTSSYNLYRSLNLLTGTYTIVVS